MNHLRETNPRVSYIKTQFVKDYQRGVKRKAKNELKATHSWPGGEASTVTARAMPRPTNRSIDRFSKSPPPPPEKKDGQMEKKQREGELCRAH